MAVELRHPKGRVFFDGNAAAAALGSLEWYRAGTTTKQTVYADKDESVPLPNPLTLDSAGRAVDSGGDLVAVYFSDSSGNDAKEVLKDSNGATVYTDDEIPQPIDPAEGLSDFAKPLTSWSTDTASSVDIGTSALGRGRLADTSSNSITYNLPSASAAGNGKGIVIKKTAAANSVTLDGDGSETIDGAGTFSWTEDGRAYRIVSDGANWRIAVAYFNQINSGDIDEANTGATDTLAGVVEKATKSEMESETSDRYPDAAILFQHPAIPKAWGFIDGAGNLAKSYNVDSVGSQGSTVSVTLAVTMADTDYAVTIGPGGGGGGSQDGDSVCVRRGSRTTTGFTLDATNVDDNPNSTNVSGSFAVFGDLA